MSENAIPRPLEDSASNPSVPAGMVVPLELVFYILLLSLALALRLLALDGIPRPEEIPHMLSAWHNTQGISPALFWAQSISFDLLGGSLVFARALTAVAGVLLAMSPAMFRRELGGTRALLLSLLLVVSAPLMITARSSSPVVWTALFAVIALRLWLNQIESPGIARGIQAVVATSALLLLGDPSGVVLALMLAAGAFLVLFWRVATADSDVAAQSSVARVRSALGQVPWDKAVLVSALIIVAFASGFMTNPSGFSSIAGLLGGIGALFQPDSQNTFGVSLFYQLFLWGLAFVALLKNNRDGWNGADRFFLGWLLAGLAALAILPGLNSQHSILITLPLCGLVSGLAVYCFVPDRHQQLSAEKYAAKGDELAMLMSPPAGRFILLLVVFALLFVFNVHLGSTTRELLQVEGGSLSGAIARMQQNLSSADFRVGLLWSFISFMFLLVGFFLAGSIWGNRIAAQGYILGLLAMTAVTQLSGGWYVSEFGAENPVEPWNHEATLTGYALLERSMFELSFRESQGFPLLPITVLREPAIGLTEDGLVGWMLRDQANVRWVDSLAEAATAPIVIAPDVGTSQDVPLPDLGGSYVGQPFIITKKWSPDSMVGLDFTTWFLQRRVRVEPSNGLSVILWVRQDVFDSRPIEDLLD